MDARIFFCSAGRAITARWHARLRRAAGLSEGCLPVLGPAVLGSGSPESPPTDGNMNIKASLAGRKTYIVAAGAILTALGAWLGDGMSTGELLTAIFSALGLSALRAGMSKAEGNGKNGQDGRDGAAEPRRDGLGGTGATVLLVVCLGCAGGCATVESGAYKVIGSTTVLVDAAMQAWADYVVMGKASAEDEAAVQRVYGDYQAAMRVCRAAVTAYRAGGNGQDAVETALDVVSKAGSALVALIKERTGQ